MTEGMDDMLFVSEPSTARGNTTPTTARFIRDSPLLAGRHRFEVCHETKSLPGSPFIRRRGQSPARVNSAHSVEHVPELPQISTKGTHERLNSASSDGSSQYKMNNIGDNAPHHICSPGNSPSLRRKVLQRCTPIVICHDAGDALSRSDDGSLRGNLSPGSPIHETIETLFLKSTSQKSSVKSASPMISPRLPRRQQRPGTPIVKVTGDGNVLAPSPCHSPRPSPRHSPCPSPRHSPCPSPRMGGRRLNPSPESHIGALTIQNVKALEGRGDKELHYNDHNVLPSINVTDKGHARILPETRTGFSHEHKLITATLVAENIITKPAVDTVEIKTAQNNEGSPVNLIDLESSCIAIEPSIVPTEQHDDAKDDETMRRCQEWLDNIHIGAKSSMN